MTFLYVISYFAAGCLFGFLVPAICEMNTELDTHEKWIIRIGLFIFWPFFVGVFLFLGLWFLMIYPMAWFYTALVRFTDKNLTKF